MKKFIPGAIISYAAYTLLKELLNENLNEGIKPDYVFADFMIEIETGDNLKSKKTQITNAINTIIENFDRFKIGKTGDPDHRSSQHAGYSSMFLICKSKKHDIIEHLEALYIDKYFTHPKNENFNRGSAGAMCNSHHAYYLYVIVD